MRNIRSVMMMALFGCAMALPASVFAADIEGSAKADKGKQRDPNEVVCEKQEVLGSRLNTRRVCMTRSEWAEHRRNDRAVVERTQMRGCSGSTGC